MGALAAWQKKQLLKGKKTPGRRHNFWRIVSLNVQQGSACVVHKPDATAMIWCLTPALPIPIHKMSLDLDQANCLGSTLVRISFLNVARLRRDRLKCPSDFENRKLTQRESQTYEEPVLQLQTFISQFDGHGCLTFTPPPQVLDSTPYAQKLPVCNNHVRP